MERSRRVCLLAASLLVGLSSCDTGASVRQVAPAGAANTQEGQRNQPVGKKMKVTIGSKTFTATLDDNPATGKFKAMLPLTVDMSELNGNEKFYRLSTPLPTDEANPGTIQNGDLLLWQSDTLVVFYKTFQTSYSYTRLGRIDDPTGLAAAVGSVNVSVTFELE